MPGSCLDKHRWLVALLRDECLRNMCYIRSHAGGDSNNTLLLAGKEASLKYTLAWERIGSLHFVGASIMHGST